MADTMRTDQEHLYVHKYGEGNSTDDYAELNNKPKINGVTLVGDMSADTLGLATKSSVPTKLSDLLNDEGFITDADVPTKLSDLLNDEGFITDADVPTRLSELINDEGFITSARFANAYLPLTFFSTISFSCPLANIITRIQTELDAIIATLNTDEYIILEQVIITNLVTLIPERRVLLGSTSTTPIYRLQGFSFGTNELVYVDVNNANIVHFATINDRPASDYSDSYIGDITPYDVQLVYNKYQKGV